jgi:catechol 2,3-dioxygenase-like lactoylglutathione lyase family enzyme
MAFNESQRVIEEAKLRPAAMRGPRVFVSRRRRWTLVTSFLCLGAAAPLPAQQATSPHIVGISEIALYAHDCERSRAYYGEFLGLTQVAPSYKACDKHSGATFRINPRQYLQLIPDAAGGTDRLAHISLETDSVEAMRAYLASRGVTVPRHLERQKNGILSFSVTDPQEHEIEFMQFAAGALIVRAHGQSMSVSPISDRMTHVGLIVISLSEEYRFYTDILRFTEFYRGSMTGTVLSWVNLKVPDGSDYIEFMLYKDRPDRAQRGSAHHLCLQVADVPASVAELKARPWFSHYDRPLQIHVGVNRRRQVNLFDPDGTRAELMEPHTIDGKLPVPSSAPPP